MFATRSTDGYANPLPGIRQKTLVFGERTLMAEFALGKGAVLPDHAHPYEQTGYLVRGHLRLCIGATHHDIVARDSWCIPANATHGAQALEDSVAVEVFSPLRKDYLPAEEATVGGAVLSGGR